MKAVDSRELRGWIEDGRELAILDAREEGEFGAGHLFWAVPCPLSRREIRVRSLLPRLGTRIVCVDEGGGAAATLAGYLAGIGCPEVAILEGGVKAWSDAGYPLFAGTQVLSRAFAVWAADRYRTQMVEASGLRERL